MKARVLFPRSHLLNCKYGDMKVWRYRSLKIDHITERRPVNLVVKAHTNRHHIFLVYSLYPVQHVQNKNIIVHR